MTKLTPVERIRSIGMLLANLTPPAVAKQFRCHVRTIGRLKNRFQQTWTTSDHPRPGRPRVFTRRLDRDIQASHLRNQFHLEPVTARTTKALIISAQTLKNRFQEICIRTRPSNV